jgi:hypothetical protein
MITSQREPEVISEKIHQNRGDSPREYLLNIAREGSLYCSNPPDVTTVFLFLDGGASYPPNYLLR